MREFYIARVKDRTNSSLKMKSMIFLEGLWEAEIAWIVYSKLVVQLVSIVKQQKCKCRIIAYATFVKWLIRPYLYCPY